MATHRVQLQAKQDHIETVVRTTEPLRAIAELVWNGFDAGATRVDVEFRRTALGGVDEIIVSDDGEGISADRADRDFGQLGESWKRSAAPSGRAYHGKEGRGRLRFFSLADRARWTSRYASEDGLKQLSIDIRAEAIETAEIGDPEPAVGAPGVSVSLHPLKQNLDALVTDEQRRQFTAIFAQYLKLYPQLELWYDGARIDPSTAIADAVSVVLPPIVGKDRTIRDVKLDIVEWSTPIDSRKIHFCGDNGIVLGSQPARINAPDFAFSIYATSSFFVELAADNLLELELTDGDFAKVVEAVRDQSQTHFRRRGHERAGRLIEELKAAGAYPYEGDPTDTLQQRERDVFDMATYAVSNYSKEFRKADTGLKRMTLTLLREALRHNPDSLTQILHAVVGLPKERQNQFSALLKKTELSNIIAASSLIADRIAFLQTLRQAVFDTEGKKVIRERGGLDLLVRDNTWIFGEQFHLAVPEAGLTKVMQRVSEDLGGKRTGGRVTKPDGRSGRVDQLLGRSIPGPHQEKREYLIVELKRPSAKADRKMLNQISDYALAPAGAPDYRHTDTRWNFFLVVGEYDDIVGQAITQEGREIGIAVRQPNYTVWVRCWGEILRECDARLQYIQDHLKVEVSDEEIASRLRALQTSFGRDAGDDPETSPAS